MNLNIVAVILTVAIILDLLIRRIPNYYVIGVYLAGVFYNIYLDGVSSLGRIIISAVWPVLALYIFYYLGALGAGDVKLFSCISLFLPTKFMLWLMVISFVTAAVYGLLQMIFCKTLYRKLLSVKNYIGEVLSAGVWTAYETNESDSFICFSVFMGIAFIITCVLEAVI